MDGLYSKTLLKWMIWGYHYFRKHPYIGGSCHLPWGERRSFTTATGHLLRHQIRHSSAGGGKLLLGASWKGLRSLLATSLGKHLWDTEKKNMWNTTVWPIFGFLSGSLDANPTFRRLTWKTADPTGAIHHESSCKSLTCWDFQMLNLQIKTKRCEGILKASYCQTIVKTLRS